MEIGEKQMKFIAKPCKCDLCKIMFNADYAAISGNIFETVYASNDFKINIREKYETKKLSLHICPECTEKLLELLDKHFPRLNLEDEL